MAEILQRHGGSIGFCDNPDDLSSSGGIQIENVAIITGRKTKLKVGKGTKAARGSALIVERTFSDHSDMQIVPNDSKVKEAQYRFTIDDARKIFPPDNYALIENAISKNIEHRKAGFKPLAKRGEIYKHKK